VLSKLIHQDYEENEDTIVVPKPDDDNGESSQPPPTASADMSVIDQSGSQRAIQNLLKVYYEPLETWFLRISIEKAHRLDSPETSSKPHLSSILDDTFYLLKLVINRALSIGSIPTIKSMRMAVVEIMERDYLNVIRKKMDGVYVQAGNLDRAERERRDRDQKSAFIVSSHHFELLGKELLSRSTLMISMCLATISSDLWMILEVICPKCL
jgi:hypothetical protein